MGLEVEVHEIWPYLCRPIDARLEIVRQNESAPAPADQQNPSGERRGVVSLPIREDNLLEDPASAHPGLTYGWNAFSGSGDVTAEVVYANYGTRADFDQLRNLGIDCRGKIVVARYGGNYRGFKAKFAEEAGAAGLIIYTDPADSGFTKGLVYPEGGWANASCIQRGSLLELPYVGDPLTPGIPATQDAVRLDPKDVGLPTIPVQPIGYAAAQAVMSLMRGDPVPQGWQGGLPFTYRISGGPDLQLRLRVQQERLVMRTANVIGRIRGSVEPQREVIIGCHHDAWGFGASDPLAGTICLMEAARLCAERAKSGWRPRRTLVFAAWGAEEFGIIGSSEWCEAHAEELHHNAVAYLNLDMAAMGPNFGASCSPSMRGVLLESTRHVPTCAGSESIFDSQASLAAAGQDAPSCDLGELVAGAFGELGGGSDHVGFYCHLGVPSCGLGGSGSAGNSYHSNYDTIDWYRHVVGDDYSPAVMVTGMTVQAATRLADDEIIPLEPWRTLIGFKNQLEALEPSLAEHGLKSEVQQLIEFIAVTSDEYRTRLDAMTDSEQRNEEIMKADRRWLGDGLRNRPWFRNRYATTDPNSGYATLTLPELREALTVGDIARAKAALDNYRIVVESYQNANKNSD